MDTTLKTILVTGGAGFLGSHLCEALLSRGHAVFCLDNFCTGSLQNIEHLRSLSQFTLIEADVSEPLPLLKLPQTLDQIYNLACPASPVQYQKDPLFTLRTSVWGAYHLLELAKERHIPLLQASTSEVYGDPEIHPQKESYLGNVNPIGIRACYDESKRCAETLCADYRRIHGVETKIARIFNTYGPRMQPDDGRVIANFIMQALEGKPLTIYGKGSQTRSFCYVDELVEGLIRRMASPYPGPINLGNPEEYSIEQLASIILAMTHSSSSLDYICLPQDDPKLRSPDISLAKELLQWNPKISLKEGLRETISYFARVQQLKIHTP